ncbi:MAG: S-layer homology domain-containing protein [Rivularia sp. (in: cyanobacteria)]
MPGHPVQNIAAATQANIVVNYPQTNTLQPNQNISRAEWLKSSFSLSR